MRIASSIAVQPVSALADGRLRAGHDRLGFRRADEFSQRLRIVLLDRRCPGRPAGAEHTLHELSLA